MRKTLMISLALLAVACGGGKGGGSSGPTPDTEEQKTLYALGASLGRSVAVFNLTADELEYVKKGLTDQVTGKEAVVSVEQYGMKLQEMARARSTAKAEAEKQRSKAFEEKAAAEAGAEKTPSGLIYKELQAGTGEQPKASDMVKVHYKGTLVDGTEFDSSYSRNQPTQFPLSGVIPCWTEGVQKMKVGGKARLICPSNIAYGDRGAPPKIPGGATLIFEVELLEIVNPQTPEQIPGHPPTGGGEANPTK